VEYRQVSVNKSRRSDDPIKRIESNRNEYIDSRIHRNMHQNQGDERDKTDDMLHHKHLIPDISNRRKTRDDNPHQHKIRRHPKLDHGHHDKLRLNDMVYRPFSPKEAKVNGDGKQQTPCHGPMKPI